MYSYDDDDDDVEDNEEKEIKFKMFVRGVQYVPRTS
jgi:hypothetical protein